MSLLATNNPSLLPAPAPGIYENIPFEDYCRWDAINNSLLNNGQRSMAHLKHYLGRKDFQSTEAQLFGTLAHTGALEPMEIARRYVVMPPFEDDITKPDGSRYANVKATKAYKEKVAEFAAVNSDKEVVSDQDYGDLMGMIAALANNERALLYLNGGDVEVSMTWLDARTGLLCKGRVDKIQSAECRFTDYKTTRDCRKFNSSMFDFGYHRQAAFYQDGLYELTGERMQACIVAQEKDAPYGVKAAPVSIDAISLGRNEYRQTLQQLADCQATGKWPGYEDPDRWDVPPWKRTSRPEAEVSEED